MGVLLEQPWLVDLLVNLLVSGIVFAIGARNFKCTTAIARSTCAWTRTS